MEGRGSSCDTLNKFDSAARGEVLHLISLEATRIGLPVNTTALFGLDPHSSMKWITSPNLRLGCPQNMTHG